MRLSDFDFDLPAEAIALRPVVPRDHARLLVVDPRQPGFADRIVRDLPDLLVPGDAMVFNDTRVIPARLSVRRHRLDGTARVDVTLHKREDARTWRAFARPGKRLRVGDRVEAEGAADMPPLTAEVVAKPEEGDVVLAFDTGGPALDAAIARAGHLPLPPYIAARRPDDARDRTDYQTVYARADGAVAAPTAGLHFTQDLLARLDARGVERHFVTLHVGAGTFLPVKADVVAEHRMHAEWGEVSAQTATALEAVRARGGRIVCVGTTSLRLLESAAAAGSIRPFSGDTSIFITPGYRFRAADGLLTNFHLPRSTLLMLVSAFCGSHVIRRAYAHAIAAGYRFYSYGDASLLFRADGTGASTLADRVSE